MKRIIALLLCLITIIICGWLILKNIDHLDIASNKSDTYAMWEKRKIDKRTDIDFCEKRMMKAKIDQSRNNDRIESDNAFKTQSVAFALIVIQLTLLIFIFLMPNKQKNIISY